MAECIFKEAGPSKERRGRSLTKGEMGAGGGWVRIELLIPLVSIYTAHSPYCPIHLIAKHSQFTLIYRMSKFAYPNVAHVYKCIMYIIILDKEFGT